VSVCAGAGAGGTYGTGSMVAGFDSILGSIATTTGSVAVTIGSTIGKATGSMGIITLSFDLAFCKSMSEKRGSIPKSRMKRTTLSTTSQDIDDLEILYEMGNTVCVIPDGFVRRIGVSTRVYVLTLFDDACFLHDDIVVFHVIRNVYALLYNAP
jgi:hypothetical protein